MKQENEVEGNVKLDSLCEETVNIVKSTASVLGDKGIEITEKMYDMMFQEHPELKSIFNMSRQKSSAQPSALARAIYAYAQNIDNLSALVSTVQLVTARHVSLGVSPDQYPVVRKFLLKAIDEILSPGDSVLNAWGEAYDFLANILINEEKNLYDSSIKNGGWLGVKEHKINRIEKESENITSFYFISKDDMPLSDFKSGQYIGLELRIPQKVIRNYTLSDSPEKDYYRISVKRDGEVSNYIHDHWKIGDNVGLRAPAGSFFIEKESEKPLVLISGGVGITPMISMLNDQLNYSTNSKRQIIFIHSTKNSQSHAMKHHIDQCSKNNTNIKKVYIYTQPLLKDEELKAMDLSGRITKNNLDSILPEKDCDYYFCGPEGFMLSISNILKEWNIPETQINYEFFGTSKF